jgi:hypothetical protein
MHSLDKHICLLPCLMSYITIVKFCAGGVWTLHWTLLPRCKEVPKKATDWSGIKKDNLLEDIQLSWCQSIDKKHIWIYIKFDGGLSIPFARQLFARKLRLKKSGTFDGRSVLLPKGGGWKVWKFELLKTDRIWAPNFLWRVAHFSELR